MTEKNALNEALWEAVRLGRTDAIRMLVKRGAEVNGRDERSGWSLLHCAVEHRMKDPIPVLVELGADINAVDFAGATPLHLAVDVEADAAEQTGQEPDPGTIHLLLQLGADPRIRDKDGKTARNWAMEAGLIGLGNVLS